MTKREELVALADWIREPDYADAFSLSDVVDWMNRRPVATAESLRAQASAAPPEREAKLREALERIADPTSLWSEHAKIAREALSSRDDGEGER